MSVFEEVLLYVHTHTQHTHGQGGLEGALVNPECVVERVPNTSHFEVLLKVESAGYFIASVLYKV